MIIRSNRISLSLILLNPSEADLKVVNVQEVASETTKSISMPWKTSFEDVTTHEKFLQLCLSSARFGWSEAALAAGLSYLASFPYAFCSCGFLGSFLSVGTAPHCISTHRASSWPEELAENRQCCQEAPGEVSLPGAAHRLDLSRLQCLRQACGEDREERASER